MKDNFGREIDYLRISVTQRCNFSCAYCGSAAPAENELSPEEFAAFAKAFARAGINKIRLTGGEPLIRGDIVEIARRVYAAAKPELLAVTTNGYLLEKYAAALKEAGVSAVNVSLDALDPDCFRRITGRDALAVVLRGLEAALRADFEKVKINAVLLRGENDGEAQKLIGLAKEYPLDVRFIELMPLEDPAAHRRLMVSSEELLRRFPMLTPLPGNNGTAVEYAAPGFRGKIGFISPVSHKFCNSCRRIRLLCTGEVKPCLGMDAVYDLRPYLNNEERLYKEVCEVIRKKPAGHHFENAKGLTPMNKIGG